MKPLCFLLTLLSLTGLAHGATSKKENFAVSVRGAQIDDEEAARLAEETADWAERRRAEIAEAWFGKVLPDWDLRCAADVVLDETMPAQASTSFHQVQGHTVILILVSGPQDQLGDMIDHGITRALFGTYFGRQIPAWAMQGAAVLEQSEEQRQIWADKNVQVLRERGIPFSELLNNPNLPHDERLHAESASLVRFLVERGGKQTVTKFVAAGMQSGKWNDAAIAHYGVGYPVLQEEWVAWVRKGLLEAAPTPPAGAPPTVDPGVPTPADPAVPTPADPVEDGPSMVDPAGPARPPTTPGPISAQATASDPSPWIEVPFNGSQPVVYDTVPPTDGSYMPQWQYGAQQQQYPLYEGLPQWGVPLQQQSCPDGRCPLLNFLGL